MLEDSKFVKHFSVLLKTLKARIASLPPSLPLGDTNSYLLFYFGDLSMDAYEKGVAFMANRQWERAFQVLPEELQRRIVRGKYGLDLLCPYLEFFSPQKGIKGTEAVGMLVRRIHQLKELLNAGYGEGLDYLEGVTIH
ncbi:hypothetical protein FB451DRAFT_1192664 [Mycena latifolia]|nr:hypothetical protein FB451DRAFT_1192664 [Mycena latifolia]